MYYESVQHCSRPVENAEVAAYLIKSGRLMSSEAPVWKNSAGQRIAAVNDGGIDSPWFEVAVINLDTDRQLDSITFGWCSAAEAAQYLIEAQDSKPLSDRSASLPIDGGGEDARTTFTCGCCGEGFTSTIAEQRIHDQDEGYGFCPSCLKDIIAA
jgi:hypothetical protein